ncbi:leucine-rich repeat-containing protein 23 isoform X1 [Pundamilia nyererei]|uniref:Leucine-rich repeat-containing protein 23 n=1 Tax=Pundamilia nyererei TaxID=303518 RepID=A0A9Y6M000_9CICH|nr:PREDICTED: leucine-rich repeat-containing protein 23 isoform X1 [Pundamilia nyererei]
MSDFDEDPVLSDVEGGEEHLKEAENEKVEVQHLTQEIISEGLSLLCRTGNGLAHAFVKLNLQKRGLEDIAAINSYIHIRFLDLSNNHLTDLSPLSSLTQLLWLKVDNNSVMCFKEQPFAQLTYLQWLSIAMNQLTDVDGLVGPALESLNLTGNHIQRLNGFQYGSFVNLVTLELRGNHLETTDGINLPHLQQLYLAQNAIKRLEGLEKLERLTTLHLRDNQLESLDGLSPSMKCLQYLNARCMQSHGKLQSCNAIIDEPALRYIGFLSQSLRVLVLSGNPVAENSEYRINVLIVVPQLERLDKNPVFPEERAEAWERIRELQEEEMYAQ